MSVLSTSPTQHEPDDQFQRLSSAPRLSAAKATWLDRWSRRAVLALMKRLSQGRIHLQDGNEQHSFGNPNSHEVAQLDVIDPRFYREIAFGSSLGAGDAYVQGYWQSDDLLSLMRVFAKNLTQQNDLQTIALPLQLAARKILNWGDRNTKDGSRRNISRHYDLSNELFANFLDPTMTYSCGIFPSGDATLEAASLEKYDRICRKLDIQESDHLIEIGCGWGGFAEYAAYNYGCRVTGITISPEQLKFAKQRIERANLQSRVELRLCDYRDLSGKFDKLVSIEMIEAVGHEFLQVFFAKCNSVLKPNGKMLLQAITIPDNRYDFYRKSVDFIQKYIFPGGCLPSLSRISNAVSGGTDMRITHLEDFAADYARTLLAWRQAFNESAEEIEALGFDAQFRRTWDYYFCYCAAGFLEKQIGVAQILMKRPGAP